MIALKLTNVKACMSHLLLMDTFDSFLLIEGEIMTFNTFKIDGFITKKTFILLKNWNKWAHSLNTLTGSNFGNTASP